MVLSSPEEALDWGLTQLRCFLGNSVLNML